MRSERKTMESPLAFLAIFSLLLLSNTVNARQYPGEFWNKGRNLRVLLHMRKAIEEKAYEVQSTKAVVGDIYSQKDVGEVPVEEEEETTLVEEFEPVGGGSAGSSGDPKEKEPLVAFSEPAGSGSGDDPKEGKPDFKY